MHATVISLHSIRVLPLHSGYTFNKMLIFTIQFTASNLQPPSKNL